MERREKNWGREALPIELQLNLCSNKLRVFFSYLNRKKTFFLIKEKEQVISSVLILNLFFLGHRNFHH